MEQNPYIRPGKHFIPAPSHGNSDPHKGNWNLIAEPGGILCYNKPYPVCVSQKKSYSRMFIYRNVKFKIVPCLK